MVFAGTQKCLTRITRSRMIPVVMLTVVMALCCGCGRSSDADPQAYAQVVAASRGSDEAIKVQVETMRDQIRDLKGLLADNARAVNIQIATEMASLTTRLKNMDGLLEEGASSTKSLEGELRRMGGRMEALESLRGTLQKLQDFDPAAFANLTTKIAEKDGELIRVSASLDAAKSAVEDLSRRLSAMAVNEQKLKDELAHVSGADISKHPMLLETKQELAALKEKNRDLQKEYDRTVALARDLQNKIDELAKGATPQPLPPTASKYEAGFSATVKSTDFLPDNQQWIILATIKEGALPARGDRLMILGKEGEALCEMKVTEVFDEKQFGGKTIDATAEKIPTDGDGIVRPVGAKIGAGKAG